MLKFCLLCSKLLAKLGTDGFSLVLFGTKVSDSKEFCKKSSNPTDINPNLIGQQQ